MVVDTFLTFFDVIILFINSIVFILSSCYNVSILKVLVLNIDQPASHYVVVWLDG